MRECPSCGYKHGDGYVDNEWQNVRGKQGEFYELPVKMRKEEFFQAYEAPLIGCPNCGSLFMEGHFPKETYK